LASATAGDLGDPNLSILSPMPQDELPPVLYKYLPPDRVDVLESRMIRFTQLSALNDPHECSAFLDFEGFDGTLTQIALQLGPPMGEPRIAEKLANPNARASLKASIQAKVMQHLRSILDGHLGVLCVSKPHDSALMWAYYAAGHRGLCIGFRSQSPLIRGDETMSKTTLPVLYVESPPKLRLESFPTENPRAVLGFKPEWWEHEGEIRVIAHLHHRDGRHVGLDDLGYPILLHPYTSDCIAEIILGARATQALEARVREICTRLGIRARLKRMMARDGTYDMVAIEIAPT
jgi:hypothetical protein